MAGTGRTTSFVAHHFHRPFRRTRAAHPSTHGSALSTARCVVVERGVAAEHAYRAGSRVVRFGKWTVTARESVYTRLAGVHLITLRTSYRRRFLVVGRAHQ